MLRKRIEVIAATITAFLLLALLPQPAHANAVTLTLSAVVGPPGNTITVDGTITNNTTSTVYLNGEDYSFGSNSYLFLNGDTTDFFNNVPLSLEANTSSGLIALFAFDIVPGSLASTYGGNFLDIIGGTNSGDFTDILASSQFSVNVSGAGLTPTPEPDSLLLLVTGLFLLLAGQAVRRRKSASCGALRASQT